MLRSTRLIAAQCIITFNVAPFYTKVLAPFNSRGHKEAPSKAAG